SPATTRALVLRASGRGGLSRSPRQRPTDTRHSMPILLTSIAFFIAAICAGLMGFAIQRGATCTVAAMDEVVRKRSVNRLAAMVEASLWVLGGLLIAQSLHLLGKMPAGYAVTSVTILGGGLLGLGAYVNKA